MCPPRDAVMATPELLECVLLRLDLRTLLTAAQRVCRAWHSLIMTSPSLQKALFFSPVGPAACDASGDYKQVAYQPNPLLQTTFPSWFPRQSDGDVSDGKPPWIKTESTLKVFLRPEASWRRMLVRQPPPCKLGTVQVHSAQWSLYQTVGVKTVRDGIRMRHLFDKTFNKRWPSMQILWDSRVGEIDQLCYIQGQEPKQWVSRAKSESDILLLLRSDGGGCVSESEDDDDDDDNIMRHEGFILGFVEKSATELQEGLEDEWERDYEGMVD
ncbi:hypothetical protein GQ53DRAFT_750550 [Thozetella sp. PMI_491]|nr:hypothetical protein GQ53DRAFT_750550 [Thozetella sp. PMI_491]